MICYRSDEVWKDIPGYVGIYQASNYGEIRTVEGKTTYSKLHGKRVWKSRVLKGRGDNPITGKRVFLYKDGKAKDFLVARLVAITFLGVPPDGFTVNHKDGNRMNNNVDNLEWLSLKDNIRHGFSTGLYSKNQKTITIIHTNTNEKIHFPSLACADRFLNRKEGYTSNRINKNNYTLNGLNGDCFRIVLVK